MTSPISASDCLLRARIVATCSAALLLGCIGCGASERDRLQHEVAGLRYDVLAARQHNDDLKRRMRLTETRDRVLVNLVKGLTADQSAAGADNKPGAAHASLVAIDRDLDELALSVRQSRHDLDALKQERQALQRELQQALDNIAQIRARERAANERLLALRDALLRFAANESGGAAPAALELRIVDNHMLLQLPDAMLFDRGRSAIKQAGKPTLNAIASALLELTDLELQIAGHAALGNADRGGLESLWQLSATRAINVARYLAERGVAEQRLSAVAYAATRPIHTDLAPELQRANRRVEIVLAARPEESTEHAAVPADEPAVPSLTPIAPVDKE